MQAEAEIAQAEKELTEKEQEFNNIVINYFEKMQHEMQHKK